MGCRTFGSGRYPGEADRESVPGRFRSAATLTKFYRRNPTRPMAGPRAAVSSGKPMNELEILTPAAFDTPSVLLAGTVDYEMYERFRSQLSNAPAQGLVVIELSTLGGDPEVARMMGEDIRFHTEVAPQRRVVFLGKAAIYSAGATFMSFFATPNRYLTRGTRLMIHERKLDKKLEINGPLTTCVASVKALLHEIEHSIAIQNEGFENLICGSKVTMDEVLRRAPSNWYLEAQEAKALGLIAGVI
jgi:ATP-dependent protease ClpP protease subunit